VSRSHPAPLELRARGRGKCSGHTRVSPTSLRVLCIVNPSVLGDVPAGEAVWRLGLATIKSQGQQRVEGLAFLIP
jgi:hypothetical protein